MNMILYEILISLSTGLMYFLTASGMSIVVSGMNVINFGQGQFYMLGTLLCYSLLKLTGSFVFAVVTSTLIVGLFGGMITEHLLRPLYGKPMLYQLLLTMGIGYVIQDMFVMFWGSSIVTMKAPSYLNFRIPMLGMKFPAYYLFLIVISLIICVIMLYIFKKTRIGMIFRAIITNRDMVSCMGINVKKLNTIMMMVGIGLSALAGALNLCITGTTTTAEPAVTSTAMCILIIGGIAEIKGAFVASLMVGFVTTFGAMYLPQYYSLLPSILMVLILLVKPEGLCGRSERL